MSIQGYTAGVFDMFHVGHLRLLRKASDLCDALIVGVTSDELCLEGKGKLPVIPLEDRMEIIMALPFVSQVVVQTSFDKVEARRSIEFHKLFVGSDWKGNSKWDSYEVTLAAMGTEIIYLPYTAGVSSSLILKRAASLEKLS